MFSELEKGRHQEAYARRQAYGDRSRRSAMTFQPELRVLSDEQVYDIHQAALEILWNTGVLVKAPEARELLRQAGAW
ncbi:MAG: hypothetical protein GWN58_16935, partial [Anaerolineae bacterium]|nr:hypothetical protein [Anaerolineae bacterium]